MSELVQKLGFLRLSLLAAALLNLIPVLFLESGPLALNPEKGTLGYALLNFVTPVMAPLLIVVVFFDYLMSRIQASDASGETRARYILIARIELGVILATVIAWLPFFTSIIP